MSEYQAQNFFKGDRVRHVATPADEVQARWDGYVPDSERQTDQDVNDVEATPASEDPQSAASQTPELPEDGGQPASPTGQSTDGEPSAPDGNGGFPF